MDEMRRVSVQDVLRARDERVQRQTDWLQQYQSPLISFTMNIAGATKVNPGICRAFREGAERIERELNRLHVEVLARWEQTSFTGCEGLWAVRGDAQTIKARLCHLEDKDALGRLFDMDVLDETGVRLQRQTERACIICGGPVRACARSRAHTPEQLFAKTMAIVDDHFARAFVRRTGEWAQRALLQEAITTPKPGLVDCENSGAHQDMDLFSFVSSACALRPYFEDCAQLGRAAAGPDALQHRGLQAEEAMLAAAGANTHKGAIFALGILCYALGKCGEGARVGDVLSAAADVGGYYLAQLRGHNPRQTGGEKQYAALGLTGARGEAANGFWTAATVALPVLEEALRAGKSMNDAGLRALMALMTVVQDSNVIRRCGQDAQAWVMETANMYAEKGFTHQDLRALNDAFAARRISPGGSADLLAVTYFLHFLNGENNA